MNEEHTTSKFLKHLSTHALLSVIQRELKAPKSQRNSFGNYNYRNCEDILEAVKPFLPDGHVIVLSDEVVFIDGRHYIKATAKITNGVESISNTAFAREPLLKKGMDESQITGATSSYARKYALNGLFAIDDTKDADSYDNRAEGKKVVTPLPASDTDIHNILVLGEELGGTEEETTAKVLSYFGLSSLDELSKEQAQKILDSWKKRKENA